MKIAKTFWGKAWCEHLENYSDYASRLPRGRTYVRNGSVVDLQITPGKVTALVAGSDLYEIEIGIKRCPEAQWNDIRARCAGQIRSLIELLQGKLSAGVMEIISGAESGLFPKPREITLNCSCPDGARMCKHVAATLYGVGARLDDQPNLLFTLRQVDHLELIAQSGDVNVLVDRTGSQGQKTLGAGDLADVFGIELESAAPLAMPASKGTASKASAKTGVKKLATAVKRKASKAASAATVKPIKKKAAPAKSKKSGAVRKASS